MTGEELRILFRRLTEAGFPASGSGYSALTVAQSGGHMVSMSATGKPGLLIRTAEDGPRPSRIRLAGLDASFGMRCGIAIDGAPAEERHVSIVEYTAQDADLPLFAEFAGTFLRVLGPRPTMAQAAAAVARFAAMFSSLTRPAKQSVTGLIGELMLLLLSSDPVLAVSNWRSTQFDHFDFIAHDARVECKATSSGRRLHSLSWEQCNPPDGPALVASLFVESTGGGTSVQELLGRIEARFSNYPDASVRLRETVASTMGAATRQCLQVRFDEAACEASLRWFDLREVPAIRGVLPVGVSSLRFMSSLDNARNLDPSVLLGTSMASLIPR